MQNNQGKTKDFNQLNELEKEFVLGSAIDDFYRFKKAFIKTDGGYAFFELNKLETQPQYYPETAKIENLLRATPEDFFKRETFGLNKFPLRCLIKRAIWQTLSISLVFFLVLYYLLLSFLSSTLGFFAILLLPCFIVLGIIIGIISYNNSQRLNVYEYLSPQNPYNLTEIPSNNIISCPVCIGKGIVKVNYWKMEAVDNAQTGSSSNDRQHHLSQIVNCTTEEKCPVCSGKGFLSDVRKNIEAVNAYVSAFNSKIGDINLKIPEINRLIAERNGRVETWNNSGFRKK